MTTATAKLEHMKRTIKLLSRIAGNIITDDHEEIDHLNRAICDLDSEAFELELLIQPATDDLAVAA